MYALEMYENGDWHVLCEYGSHEHCSYWAKYFLRCDPDVQLVIVSKRKP